MKSFTCYLVLGLLAFSGAASATTWDVSPAKSHLEFVGKESGKDFHGEFKKFDCKISFDKNDLAHSSIEVSVDTASAITGNKVYDEALPGSDWFHTKAFPVAVFKSSSIKALPITKEGQESYEATGVLSLIGGLQPITLPFTLTRASEDEASVRAEGTVTLKRLDFLMGNKVDASGDMVSNDILVRFDITAQKTSPQNSH